MVVRLLLVVLALAGPIPVRFCTCGAAHHHDLQPADCPSDTSAPDSAGPADHHCDCAAVKPQIAVTEAVVVPHTDAPVAGAVPPFVLAVPSDPAARPLPPFHHPPPTVPLYLALLNLRN